MEKLFGLNYQNRFNLKVYWFFADFVIGFINIVIGKYYHQIDYLSKEL